MGGRELPILTPKGRAVHAAAPMYGGSHIWREGRAMVTRCGVFGRRSIVAQSGTSLCKRCYPEGRRPRDE